MNKNKSLRPNSFNGFIGQKRLVKTLKVMIASSIKRKTSCDHILLYGKPGFGKTTLAKLIAKYLKSNIKYVQGPLLEKKSDILSLFSTIESNDVVLIDEIHGINKQVEELLYTALEEGVVDIVIGVEGESKIVRMKLPKFTVVGATTKIHSISKPLKDRFGLISKLIDYNNNEIKKIIKNSVNKLKFKADEESLEIMVQHSGYIPRKANNILKRCIDFSLIKEKDIIDSNVAKETLKSIGIYKNGLNDQHLEYLSLLSENFEDKSVSLDTIIGMLGESKENIEQNIESSLLSLGYISKSSKGRKITQQGKDFLNDYNLS